jgi:hypothetical protein
VAFTETIVTGTGLNLNLDRKRPWSVPDRFGSDGLNKSTRNYGA